MWSQKCRAGAWSSTIRIQISILHDIFSLTGRTEKSPHHGLHKCSPSPCNRVDAQQIDTAMEEKNKIFLSVFRILMEVNELTGWRNLQVPIIFHLVFKINTSPYESLCRFHDYLWSTCWFSRELWFWLSIECESPNQQLNQHFLDNYPQSRCSKCYWNIMEKSW